MKRFLFLVCGAALLLIAGGRFFILLGDYALQPDSYRATAQIQFAPGTPLPQSLDRLPANLLSSLAKSPKFVKQLASEIHHTAALTEVEAIKLMQDFTTIQHDPTHNTILLTYYGYDSDNTASVANVLARAWVEENSPTAKVFPAAAQVAHPPLAGFFNSSHVLIPLMATLAGAVIFFLGWRMPTTLISNPPAPAVVEAKY